MKAVVWDLDGTLVDSEPLHFALTKDVCRAHGIRMTAASYRRFVGMTAPEIFRVVIRENGLDLNAADLVAEKAAGYARRSDLLRARPQAIETWRRLEALGVRQAVVSNADRLVCQINLAAIGLARPGLITVARNDVRVGKPGPEPYLRAAYLLGERPEDCVAVEDSPTGAASALAAGLTTLYWPQDMVEGPAPQGCLAVEALTDVDWPEMLG